MLSPKLMPTSPPGPDLPDPLPPDQPAAPGRPAPPPGPKHVPPGPVPEPPLPVPPEPSPLPAAKLSMRTLLFSGMGNLPPGCRALEARRQSLVSLNGPYAVIALRRVPSPRGPSTSVALTYDLTIKGGPLGDAALPVSDRVGGLTRCQSMSSQHPPRCSLTKKEAR
jgi:hypothetical protein